MVKSPSIQAARSAASPPALSPWAIISAPSRALPVPLTAGWFLSQRAATSSLSADSAVSAWRRRIFWAGQSEFWSIKPEISANRPVTLERV